MPREQQQVAAQRPGVRVVPVRVRPQLHEHVLHDILRAAAGPDDVRGRAVHRGPEAVEHLGQRMIVACCQPRRQQGIGPPHNWEGNAAAGGSTIFSD